MADDDDHFFSVLSKMGSRICVRRLHGMDGKHTGSFVLSEKVSSPRRYPQLDEVEERDYVAIHNRREVFLPSLTRAYIHVPVPCLAACYTGLER
jgi:hypothetical protein